MITTMRRTLALLAIVTGLIFAAGQAFYLDQQARAAGFLLLVKPGGGASAQSLVLSAASSQFLSRTWGSAPTDNKKATISFFVKRTVTGTGGLVQYSYDGGDWAGDVGSISGVRFNNDTVDAILYDGGLSSAFGSSDTITDTTTWHHVCIEYDSTQATGTSRTRIYIDGVEVSYAVQTPIISQNSSFHLTDNGILSVIGEVVIFAGGRADSKLAYFYLIDGQALTPSSFTTGTGSGTTHSATYGGTYGTNGFFLNFSGNSTADQSGNHNDWTQNGSPTFSPDLPL